jgi:hypothetical protein
MTDLPATFCRQIGESQASFLLRSVAPSQFPIRFDSDIRLGEPEMDRPRILNGDNGSKTKPSF